MTKPIPIHERMRGLMTTLATAGHQLNMGDNFPAIDSLRLAGAQLGALRATVDALFGQNRPHRKTKARRVRK